MNSPKNAQWSKPQAGWSDILDPGEVILWQGRPDGRVIVDASSIVMGIFGAVFAGFAAFWMIMASQAGGYFWMFGLIHFSVGIAIMGYGPIGRPFARRHTWYTLTNRRAIIATNLPLVGKRLHSYPITAETPISMIESDPATIIFATAPVSSRRGVRTKDIGFERIPDGHRVMSLMRKIQTGAIHDEIAQQDAP